jgi:hypothetical protein
MAGTRMLLALALLMLALLAMVHASAFKLNNVDNGASIIISQSDVAGLAVGVSSGNSPNQVTYSGGQAQVHFAKGTGAAAFSLQTSRTESSLSPAPDILKMLSVLSVTNHSGYCQDIAVYVTSGSAVNLANIYGRPPGGVQPGTLLGNSSNILKVQPTGQMVVDFWWNATTAAASAGNFTLTVKGTNSASCP